MIARFGEACARWAERTVPHPFVFALLLTAVTLVAGFVAWDAPPAATASGLLAAWFDGFWSTGLLAFGFQMALVLVTGYAVADAPPVRRLLARVGGWWRTPAQAAALVTFASLGLSFVHWGLGLMGGAILAREVGRAAERRRVAIPYAVIAASAYVGFLSWHGGLSGSAPLVVAQAAHAQVDLVGVIPVSRTLFRASNLALFAMMLVALPLVMAAMARRAPARVPALPCEAPAPEEADGDSSLAARLGDSRALAALIVVPAMAVLALVLVPGIATGARGFDLNAVLFLFLLGALALHGSAVRTARSISAGAGEVGGILLQFPFYFALLGVMQQSGLIAVLSDAGVEAALALARLGVPVAWAFQMVTFLSAGLVNLFVPSGGGQWAVQGEIVMRAALHPELMVEPARAVMALAYGDAWTNMLQPFWALALLSITHTRAKDILGYTAAAMVMALPLYLVAFAM